MGGACSVHMRYIYSVARAAKPSQVFAQMLMGFELASRDPRVVGLNLVQPEDWFVPMHDFHLHMLMLRLPQERVPECTYRTACRRIEQRDWFRPWDELPHPRIH